MTDFIPDPLNSADRLEATVIRNGYCVGCGACASYDGAPFEMRLNGLGQYEAKRAPSVAAGAKVDIEALCPFSDRAKSEDELARTRYDTYCRRDPNLGYYLGAYAGHVTEGDFRDKGSSGGFGTWIVHELFDTGLIDYVIHVQPTIATRDGEPLFAYTISDETKSIRQGAKSRYYPIELSAVLRTVRNQPGRYAIVGLPCFIKSIRLLQSQDPLLTERIQFCIGLVCGHLKSTRYAESLAWQMGIPPSELKTIDFRVKDPVAPADRYSVSASNGTVDYLALTNELFGTDWGAGTFKYKACDFCDDVFAETADVVLGDAWLPEFVSDSKGTNVLVVRNQDIKQLIEKANETQRILIQDLPIDQAILSQTGGLRHRRDAISYRLKAELSNGSWVPRKRFKPSSFLFPGFEKRRQDLRARLRELSHTAFDSARARGDLAAYVEQMRPLYSEYRTIHGGFFGRLKALLRRKLRGLR